MQIDDDVFEYIPHVSKSCRLDLYVARTRLKDESGSRYDFWGLYCHSDIHESECIGMYTGQWSHSHNTFPWGDTYTVEVASSLIVSPPPDNDRIRAAGTDTVPCGKADL